MDIDCDGVSTSHCNHSADPWYQGQTSFETSKGKSFQADSTHYFVIVYAVFADEGPNDIIGEASYATAQALGINPDPANGGTDSGVTYIVFTGKVPNPVENNATIDQVGAAAATAFVNG